MKVWIATARLRKALDDGKIKAILGCYSPADIAADTRYIVRTNDDNVQTIFHREIAGFISGLYRSE